MRRTPLNMMGRGKGGLQGPISWKEAIARRKQNPLQNNTNLIKSSHQKVSDCLQAEGNEESSPKQ